MINKEIKVPKEIYTNPLEFSQEDFTDGGSCMIGISEYPVEPEDIKYLSETHVSELLEAKDKEIRDLVKLVAERNAELAEKDKSIAILMERIKFRDEAIDISGTNEIYAHMDIRKLKQELSSKDKEIDSLKLEIARLSENNASLEFKISAKYKQGYRDGVKDWEDEHLKNN